MATKIRLPLLLIAFVLAGCAATPQIQVVSRDMTVEVKSKVSLIFRSDYSTDGKNIAAASIDGTVALWDLEGARQARAFNSHAGAAVDVAFSPDGKTLAVSNTGGATVFSDDVTVLWDVATGAQTRVFPDNFGGNLSFSPDGRRLLGGRFSGDVIRLRDIQSGKVIREYAGSGPRLSLDGKYVVAVNYEGALTTSVFVNVLDAATGATLWRTETGSDTIAFTPDRRQLLVAAVSGTLTTVSPSFKVFDIATGKLLREFGNATFSVGLSSDFMDNFVTALAFSPDGRQFLAGDMGGRYRLWNVSTGTMVRQLKTPDELAGTMLNAVPSVKFSPDGKSAVVTSLASTRLYDVSTGDELATMISFEDGEWVATTPSGYYNSSEKGDQYLDVTVAGKPYSISQLRESFYRPDLVKVALSGRALTGLRKVAEIKPPPGVAIVETPASVSSEDATVKVRVADQGGGVGDVRLYLNDSAIVLDRSRNKAAEAIPGGTQVLSYKVRLVAGTNRIRAIAFNADNSMQSANANHTIEASIVAARPSLHAIVIGINDYEDPRLALRYPVADAQLVAATLRQQVPGLFESVNIVELTSRSQTTREAISKALQDMSGRVRPDDLFVFFVASHGTVDDGEYFLITSNVGATSTHILKRTALSQEDLKLLIANIPATKKLVVIDTCNAGKLGEVIQMAMLTRGMNEETALKILSRAVGSTIISASTSMQQAVEGYKGHGLFTWVVVEGLKGAADSDKDGYVKTHELVNFVDDKVPALAEQVFRHKQYPTTTLSGQGFPVMRVR
ncbi:MAG: caspase family protein [Betaproteobacteria bacterium]|nr:caspase family protein [Betaproteobacteria bacterium]